MSYNKIDVHNGTRIEPTEPGMLPGPSKVGEILSLLNGLGTWKVIQKDNSAGKVTISEGGTVLEIPTGGIGDAGPPGAVSWQGEYSLYSDYEINDAVYTIPDTDVDTRYLWVAEIATGPSSVPGEIPPAWPESGTVYWRCYARSKVGGGGIVQCTITTLYNDNYFQATPVAGGAAILVAKQIPSRGNGSGTENAQTVSGETQVMRPSFNVGDIIYAGKVDAADVVVGGTALTYIEVSNPRCWCHVVTTPTVSGTVVYAP